jgi:hypothetical protein
MFIEVGDMQMVKKPVSNFIKPSEIAEICAVSMSKAYKIVAELNKELQKRGKFTIRGKTNRRFFEEKYLEI